MKNEKEIWDKIEAQQIINDFYIKFSRKAAIKEQMLEFEKELKDN